MKHHIFWDFNGTIIDDIMNACESVNDMLARKGKAPITLEQYYTYVETPIIGFYRHILTPEELDFDDISRQYHEDYARRSNETFLADYAKELIEKLYSEGAKQYIITSNYIEEVNDLLKKHGIADYFEAVLGADDKLAESKAERAKKFYDSADIDANDAIFIGDTLHDLETANALGIDCVLVSYGHQGRRLLNDHNAFCVDTLRDVEKVIYDERTVDFHIHSTCSDGTMTPSQLMEHAKASGLSAVALTDHDAVNGIKEAAKKAAEIGLEFIPGIEFSAAEDTELHVIGLYIDTENEILRSTIDGILNSRKRRMEDICSKLRSLGIEITYEEALDAAGGDFVGRAHIAKVLMDKGVCKTVRECFDKYIGLGKPCYSEKHELTAVQAVKAIKAAGGAAFLAHLHQTGYDEEKLDSLLGSLKKAGLDGIEGYYTEYTPEMISTYRKLAQKHSLALSGGSDFHADMKPNVSIGVGYGNLRIPYCVLENIKEITKKK